MAYLSSFPIKISKPVKRGLMGNHVLVIRGFDGSVDASRSSRIFSLICRVFQEENQPPEGDKEEPPGAPAAEEVKTQRSSSSAENFQERRALAIAAKAQEIEKVNFHLCSIFKYLCRIYKRTYRIFSIRMFTVLISSWKFVRFL